MKEIYTHLLIVFVTVFLSFAVTNTKAQSGGIPPGWEYQATSSSPHGMIVMLEANPRINDIQIAAGDYIGAFYTDDSGNLKCGGADFWLGDENIIFAIFGDDPETPEKDGFAYGEEMHFKVWSWSNQKAYDVDDMSWDPEYYGTRYWNPLGLSAMTNLQCLEEFDAFASASPNPVCQGNEVTLSANIFIGTTGNYTYTWTSYPAGLNSTEPMATVSPATSTTYFLEVSDGILTSDHAITVQVQENPIVDAGEDFTVCPDCSAELEASGEHYSELVWSSTGDGTFSDPSAINPTYYPGSTDTQNGITTILVTASPVSACEVVASDELTLYIQPLITIGIPEYVAFCGNEEILLNADVENYNTLQWSTSGDGTFSDPHSEITQYFPGPGDLQVGEFMLEICAIPIPPAQQQVCKDIQIEIYDKPMVNAPASLSKCDNVPVPVTCIPSHYSSLHWSTSGDGTFDNPEAASTSYHAGVLDKLNGGTTVTVDVFGAGPCENFPAGKNINITLHPSPMVDAGDVSAVCENQNLQLDGSVGDCVYFMWSTSGDGYFSNMIAEDPLYYPGTGDISNGNFLLTLTGYPNYPCTATVMDELSVEIVGEPDIAITTGVNQIFPLGVPLALSAQGSGFQSVAWETSGDGTFDNPESLNPLYMPGPVADASGDPVVLSITAHAAEGCGQDAADNIVATFTEQTFVDAGEDITACATGANLQGSSQGCTEVLWTTSGDGTFTDPNTESTTYISGPEDVISGTVEVCLNGYYGDDLSVSDCINILVTGNPVLETGFEQLEACYNEPVSIQLENAANYSSVFWYTTNGGGEFNNIQGNAATYYPAPTVDYPQGCITVFVLAQPIAPCSTVAETSFDVCFHPNPQLDAGFDVMNACYDQPVNIELETAENYSSLFWYTTNGGGDFSSSQDGSVVYYPAPNVDYPQGCISIFALAQPVAPCTVVDEENFELCFQSNPTVDAGEDQTITENESFIPEVDISGQGSVYWETSGDGSFSDASVINAEYYPGIGDIANGNVILTINVLPPDGCTTGATDEISLTIFRIQTALLPEGWSGFSSYIDVNSTIEEFFEPIQDVMISAQTISKIYWPDGGINTIGYFDCGSGYKVRLNEATEFTVTGPMTTNRTINLQSGWNLIPVLSTCFISQAEFLNLAGDHLVLMKEIAGTGIIWPDMGIYNLGAVIPGKAYLVAVDQAISITYNDCDGMKSGYEATNTETNTPWPQPEQTTISHSIAITSGAMDDLETGDFLGAFSSSGKCVGLTQISNTDENTSITVFGDEPMTTETEGMLPGEAIGFKIFKSNTEEETTLDVGFSNINSAKPGLFAENGMSVINEMHFKTNQINDQDANDIDLYPNPTVGKINFKPENTSMDYRIILSNMSGQILEDSQLRGDFQMDISEYPKGFYLVTIQGDAYYKVEKLVLK